ncbi:vcbs repeat-containing protein [Rhodopirellula maiorica SM1]|uniref:Vcbs repeat-containing protein n=1 Tax=Rhodopirellula maiorica SM1 TaxID=1265738 RepID=M5S594_9BACT|nr:DUF4347 domain-containing protein [Rhodopirellula maiorica]EMI21354.1 vcbs repeat-containing protein [Rhodopirellula maiorica SM1]
MSLSTRNWWQQTLLTLDQLTECTRKIVRGPVSRRSWQRGIELAPLEPRILFSASPIDVAAMESTDDTAVMVAEVDAAERDSVAGDGASQNEIAQAALEIVVVDSRVQNLDQLLEDLDQSDRNIEFFVLDADRDGVDQISEILGSRTNVASLHIVSHAEDFAVRLGNTWLASENLDGYAGQIAGWHSALTSDADILFYGCDLASGESGRSLIDAVGTLSGADVAASDDDTGYANFGADWDLEYHTGVIESEIVFSSELQQNWVGKLATITVDTLIDEEIANGQTSLREAITLATAGDTIVLGAGTYNLTIDTLEIDKTLTVTGADARSTIIDGTALSKRVFELQESSVVTMSGMTIQGGDESNGGGILVDSSAVLNLSDALLQNNSSNDGGAIHVHGTANLQRVLLFNNNASSKGGAINFHGADGGSLTNVTISGNTASSDGGGLHTDTNITITNSTITLNTGDKGGGIVNSGAVVTISNTIVAGNTGVNGDADVIGDFSSNGANLIQSLGSATGFGSDITGVNPNLAALANNGGSTDTHAIDTSSAAYNAGTAVTAPSVDQRGVARNGSVDIGAYEYTAVTSILLSTDESVSGSEAPGLSDWDAGEVLDFGDINSLDPVASATDGTFSSFFNLSSFVTGGADIEAINYVTEDITIGNSSTIALQAGDILFATRDTENLVSTNSLTVTRNDLVIFRPDAVGDYSAGTFQILLENPVAKGFHAVTLITKNTLVGDVVLTQGSFLLAHTDSAQHHKIQYYTPDNVGASNTTGTLQTLIDESSILSGQLQGLDLVEDTMDVGGHTLRAGEILVSVKDGGTFGSNSVAATGNDIFSISVTTTDLGSAASNFTATLVMDGSDVGLDTTSAQIFGFSLFAPAAAANTAPVISSDGGGASAAINVGENTVAVTTVTANDADVPAQTLTYTISGGADAAKFAIDSATGELSFVTPPNFEAPSDVGGNNVYDVTVSVSDGTLNDTQTIAVTVTDASETLTATNEFLVNDEVGDQQITSAEDRGNTQAVSMAADGSYVVVWTSLNQDGSGKGVYAQRFAANGTAITSEFRVNETITNDQQWASVASAFDGTFVVTWTSNQGATGDDIYYRRFAADGTALTNELVANDSTSGTQKNSIIGMNSSTGEFVIAWQGNGTQTGEIDSNGIFAQRFDSSGSAIGTEFRVNGSTSGTQYDAAISVNTDGDFVVVWDDTVGVHFQRFDSSGNEQGGQETVSGSVYAGNAAVAMHNDGSFVVAWRQSGTLTPKDIYLQQYSNTGATVGSTQTVNSTSSFDQEDPSITMAANGEFIVVWEGYGSQAGHNDSSGIFGQKYHANGSEIGNEFRINETTSGTQSRASLAAIDIDNFVVVWSGAGDQTGEVDSSGVFARQYGTASVNTAPTVTLTNKLASLAENADTGSSIKISDIVIADDGNGTNVLSLTGDDANMFEIVGGNELHLKAGVSLDFETNPSLDVTVHVDDAQIGVASEDSDGLSIAISDINEAPTVTLTPVVTTLGENADTSSAIIVATITVDDDALGSETLTVSGTDAALFEIVGNNLRLIAGASLDFETNPSLDVTVNVDDNTISGNPDDSANHSIAISDQNDAPTIGGTSNKTMNDNATKAVFDAVTIGDVDGDNVSITVSLSGGDTNGSFTTASLIASGFSDDGGGVYSRTASSTAAAQTAIRQLIFDPTENQATVGTATATTITITVDDSQTTKSETIVVDATSINDDATGQPVIVGVAAQGQTLTANTSGIADDDGLGSFVYQWTRGGSVIGTATSSTYTLTAADIGHAIRVSVSFTDALGSNEGPLLSTATANVASSNVAPVMTDTLVNAISGQRTEFAAEVFERNSVDANGDPLTAVLVTPPASGSLTVDPTGRFVYTSDEGFTGTVSFQWKANDGATDSNVATVVIQVRPAAIPLPAPPQNNTPDPEPQPEPETDNNDSDNDSDGNSDSDNANVSDVTLVGMQSDQDERFSVASEQKTSLNSCKPTMTNRTMLRCSRFSQPTKS